MDYLINILGMACIAAMYVDLIDTLDTEEIVPQKPFKCALCSGFWLSVIPFIVIYGLQGLLIAGITGVTTELIDRKLNQ